MCVQEKLNPAKRVLRDGVRARNWRRSRKKVTEGRRQSPKLAEVGKKGHREAVSEPEIGEEREKRSRRGCVRTRNLRQPGKKVTERSCQSPKFQAARKKGY
ncbi:hypothetical protein WQ57_16120 [Mesobacillus campisalis]|uniref:Uncharacterized protein n=1 Tax=Mesobacillus campisalis TaxID=1408103 RepID=A0A0M2SWU2_9BACI|nr:hypothetical protein WQ57_16120 [Mesobacillus campisalis]